MYSLDFKIKVQIDDFFTDAASLALNSRAKCKIWHGRVSALSSAEPL